LARQCYEADSDRSFDELRQGLTALPFQPRLGSVADKVGRIVALVEPLATASGYSAAEVHLAVEAAALCKCDLATSLVRQLPALRGVVGRAYATQRGVAESIAAAIDEHHAPRLATDPPAASALGALLAVADRLDTLVGCTAINIMPMGAADPFDLRSVAIGLLRTLIQHRLPLQLDTCVRVAYAGYSGVTLDAGQDEVVHRLRSFFEHRLRGVLTQSYPASVVQAAIEASKGSPHAAAVRAAAMMAAESTPL
jgi:glycyl-tRNA synthetase beta chain